MSHHIILGSKELWKLLKLDTEKGENLTFHLSCFEIVLRLTYHLSCFLSSKLSIPSRMVYFDPFPSKIVQRPSLFSLVVHIDRDRQFLTVQPVRVTKFNKMQLSSNLIHRNKISIVWSKIIHFEILKNYEKIVIRCPKWVLWFSPGRINSSSSILNHFIPDYESIPIIIDFPGRLCQPDKTQMNSRFGNFKKPWWNFGFELGIGGQEGTGIWELSNINILSK